MGLFKFMEQISGTLSLLMQGPATSFCRLETADDDFTLAADDGSLVSAIRIEGLLVRISESQYQTIVAKLTEKIQPLLSEPGHKIQIVFEYNPLSSSELVKANFSPTRASAAEMGISLDTVISDWEKAISRYCAGEKCWLVVWTDLNRLSDLERKKAHRTTVEAIKKDPLIENCQRVSRGVKALRSSHSGAVHVLLQAFKEIGALARLLEARSFLRDLRVCVDPAFTPSAWEPRLPGDRLPAGYPDDGAELLGNVFYPSLASQIFPREAEVLGRHVVKIGDQLHAPFLMAIPPQTPQPFNELFRMLAQKGLKSPLRLCLTLAPDGLNNLSFKGILAQILSFTSSGNKRLVAAIEELRALELRGMAIVQFSMCFDTWVELRDFESEAQAESALKSQLSELVALVGGWGICSLQDVVGDPLLGTAACMPGMMPASPAPKAAAPLNEVLGLLPFRPACPWKQGSLLLRSNDGKLLPYEPNSSEQAAWIDIGVAPMGGGKSVLLNSINFAFAFQAGLTRLPWISIIDVGPSSSGLISLLKASLPPHRQHLAAYHRLRMTPDYAINPFDLPLGCRHPLPAHESFLVNLLCLLATPLNADAPPPGIDGLARAAVKSAYDALSDNADIMTAPRVYSPITSPEIHDLLISEGFEFDSNSIWWEAVDFLFDRGHIHEAMQAQRYAVPTLSEVAARVNEDNSLREVYGFCIGGTDEPVLNYFWRTLGSEALDAYPILTQPTRFSLGDAQIVSLDLDEVAPRSGPAANKQAAVMYMLARHVVGSRFFMMPADVPLMPVKYQAYHEARINEIRQDPKRLCYDEVHRVTSQTAVANQIVGDLETSARESRKWNLSIGLYSQTYEDFPKTILELATSIFILGSGTEAGRRGLVETFGLNETMEIILSRIGKPSAAGSELVGIFKTGRGVVQQSLMNTIGPVALWAFSSTTEDVTVRNALYNRFGIDRTLRLLGRKWPGGVKEEAERRKINRRESDIDELKTDVLQEIINELSEYLIRSDA